MVTLERHATAVRGKAVCFDDQPLGWPQEIDLEALDPGVDQRLREPVAAAVREEELLQVALGSSRAGCMCSEDGPELPDARPARVALQRRRQRAGREKVKVGGFVDGPLQLSARQ